MQLFEDIKLGLEEAIKYEKGSLNAKKTTLTVQPLESFSPIEIKSIRKAAGLTQALFAKYMGVSVKTVEAWEAGKNHPDGVSCRMLSLTKKNPSFPFDSGIIIK